MRFVPCKECVSNASRNAFRTDWGLCPGRPEGTCDATMREDA